MEKHPYIKASGISLILHIVLLSCLTIVFNQFAPVSVASPIVIELMPATVADTGDTLKELNAAVQEEQLQPNRQAEAAPEQQPAETVRNRQQLAPVSEAVAVGAETDSSEALSHDGSNDAVGNTGDNQVQNTSQVRTQAKLVSGSRPAYPRDAWKAGWEGIVVVRVLVGANGSALSTAVQHSSGFASLDAAAAQAVGKWQFSPAQKGDIAVESFHDVRVRFRLADGK